MAVIYLKHERHGTKVATLELEAQEDEKRGWKRYKPDEPAAVVSAPVVQVPPTVLAVEAKDELAEVAAQWAAKFGKKPHHKKSVQTLKAELAA